MKAGEKSRFVVFWKWLDKIETVENEDGEQEQKIKRIPYLTSYAVFHVDQTEGIEKKFNNEPVRYEHDTLENAEAVIANYVSREGLTLKIENGERAFYRPSQDLVQVPELAQYKIAEEYYSTLFHELTHSTGHAKRLNREGVSGFHYFGDENYSKEELIAEIGSAFICQMLGISCDKAFENSVAYIRGWLKALKNDKKLIVAAAAKAEQAVDFIMNK